MNTVTLVFISHLFQNPRAKCHCNSEISFLKMGTQQECPKKVIEIFNARLGSVYPKTVSNLILKQYKESLEY